MKIAQITVHFSPNVGGVETHLDDLVSGLASLGNSVFVLTYQPLQTKASFKIYENKKNITIFRLPWFRGLFYKLVNKPALEFVYLTPLLFVSTPIFLLSISPEVIHAHGLIAGFISVFWAKVFSKRVIVSTHSLYQFPSGGAYRNLAKWIFSNADCVLCLSNQSVEEIVSLGVDKQKVKRFTYWVDTNQFKPQNKATLKSKLNLKGFNVLFVGRLVEAKGIKVLIKAAKKLPKNINILIAGDGPLKEYVESSSKKLSNIHFLGRISNTNLPEYYNAADLVIVPSIHEEGFGRVILESLSCGTPVIAANRGAIPEAMDDSVGQIINISAKNIVESIVTLSKNKNKLARLSSNAKIFSSKSYSKKNIEQIIRNYK